MSIIARLGVYLGINTVEFTKGLDEATKKTREFEKQQKEIAKRNKQAADEFASAMTKVGAAAVAVSAIVVSSMKRAADITDISEGFDLTVESLLATEKALMLAAGKAEDIGNVLNKLAQAQDAAKEGNDAVRESFKRLGVSAGEIESAKLDELFVKVAKELSQIEDTSKRAALAQDLLGKAVRGVNWAEFVKQYKQFSDPELVAAIEVNDKAWESIELSMKSISQTLQIMIKPISQMVLDSQEIAKNFGKIESHQLGIASIFQMMFAPKTLGANQKFKKPTDILEALPPESSDTPMLYDEKKGYSQKSDKEKAAEKAAADEAKRIKESREQMKLDIDLIRTKAKIAMELFAVNSKGIVLGQEAISQEKMLLDLANSITEIRSIAAKERAKDKAQIDLINQKEQEQIAATVSQFGFANGLRMQQREREHKLAMQFIEEEGIAQRYSYEIAAHSNLDLLDVEKERFELGNAAYELKKLDAQKQISIRDLSVSFHETIKQITKEYDLSAKSAMDLELYEQKIDEAKRSQLVQLRYLVAVEDKKKEILKEQIAIEERMFKLDLAQQKGRDIANIQSQLAVDKDRLGLEFRRYQLSTNQYNLQSLQLENVNRLIQAEKKYSDQQKEAYYEMQRQGGGQLARERYEDRIKAITEVRDIELRAIEEVNDARQRNAEAEVVRQKSFTEGWEYAARRFREDAENAFNRGQAAFGAVMSNMDAAINNFVETGKFAFEDFALSVIKDLIRIEMQAQATMLMRMVLGSFGGISLGSPNVDAGITGNIGMAAAGGTIDGPTIVGENGPELFIPSQRGTVIPNTIAPSMAGMNQPQVVYNGPYIENMSAIDTQSAAQFLSKNKMSVWAANKSADRSVPVSR